MLGMESWEGGLMPMKEGPLPPFSAHCFCESPNCHMAVTKHPQYVGCGAGWLSYCHTNKSHLAASRGVWSGSSRPHYGPFTSLP